MNALRPSSVVSSPPTFQRAASENSARVGITRLTLTNFRSYRHLRLDADARPVVLTGPNGAGKTNLLEALSFLAPGRGLRAARLTQVGRTSPGADASASWAVAATLSVPDGRVDLGTGLAAGARERRTIHVDGQPAKGAGALAQHFGVVWLTPAMDRLFLDGPASRRKFLDRLVTAFDAQHAGRMAAYDHAYRQRLRLLRDGGGRLPFNESRALTARGGGRPPFNESRALTARGGGRPPFNESRALTARGDDAAWFAALEDTMARHGVALAAARYDLVTRLNHELAARTGPFPAATLALVGAIDGWLAEKPAVEVEDAMRRSLWDERRGMIGAGAGPHCSDLGVAMVAPGHASHGQPAAVCSTGEQKALLISILLAHARLQRVKRGHAPVLLLDEVAAHLDQQRRLALFDEIVALGAQAWMTGTDAMVFESLGNNAQFFVAAGADLVRPQSRPT